MTRAQAEQYLRSMRNSRYDPWVVNGFLEILDRLEAVEVAEAKKAQAQPAPGLTRVQLQIIHAARAEDREIIRLKRDLTAASSAQRAVDLMLDRLQPIVPAMTLAMYLPLNDSIDLFCAACAGLGATAIAGTRVPIGERITGWVYVNRQAIVNAEAALELSEAARRSSPVSLSHALVVPMLDAGRCSGVIALFAAESFSADHQRLVETAVSLLPRGFLSAAAS